MVVFMSRKEPIYQTILSALVLELNANHFRKNDPFYSESELRKKYQVSSTTVVRVLNMLADQGYIYRVQGKGSFVSKFNRGTAVRITDTHTYDIDEEQVAILVADQEMALPTRAKFEDGTAIWYLERLREIKRAPFEFSQSWYLASLIPDTAMKKLREVHSIYAVIRKHAQLDLSRQPFEQEYAATCVPSQRIADYLHVGMETTVIKIERWVFQGEQPLEYTVSYMLPNYFGLALTSDSKSVTTNRIR